MRYKVIQLWTQSDTKSYNSDLNQTQCHTTLTSFSYKPVQKAGHLIWQELTELNNFQSNGDAVVILNKVMVTD